MIPQALIVPSWYKPLLLSKQALSLRPSGSCLAWDDKVKKARWDNSFHWLAFHLISFPGAIPAQHSLASTSWCKSIWDGRQEDKGPTQLLQRKPSTNMFFCFNHSFPEASLAQRPLSSPSWCKSTATTLRRPSRRSRPNATASTPMRASGPSWGSMRPWITTWIHPTSSSRCSNSSLPQREWERLKYYSGKQVN